MRRWLAVCAIIVVMSIFSGCGSATEKPQLETAPTTAAAEILETDQQTEQTEAREEGNCT